MRITFLGPFCSSWDADYGSERQVGAIEQQFHGVARKLVERGHEVLLTRNWKGKRPIDSLAGVNLVNVTSFGKTEQGFRDSKYPLNYISYVRYLTNAPRIVSTLKPDIVIASGVVSAWIASKFINSMDSNGVFVAINNDVYVHRGLGTTRTPHLTKLLLENVGRHYNSVVAVAPSACDYLSRLGISCRAVIPCAIAPQDYGNLGDEGFILTAARLVPHKRIRDLIWAFSKIKDEIDENLVVLGSGPCEDELKLYAKGLTLDGRIRFVPFLPKSEYRSLLSKCSIFVLPSEAETFGVVIIEAMASEKTVVARNTIGPRDIITQDMDGILYDDVSKLPGILHDQLSDRTRLRKIGINARETIDKKYTFERTAKQYEKLFEEIVN